MKQNTIFRLVHPSKNTVKHIEFSKGEYMKEAKLKI